MSNIYTVKCPPDYDDGLLYHFTNGEALFKILESMTLKLSSMSSVDDLNEKCICCRDDGWGTNGINIENSQNIKFIMNAAKSGQLVGVHAPISRLISVAPKYKNFPARRTYFSKLFA